MIDLEAMAFQHFDLTTSRFCGVAFAKVAIAAALRDEATRCCIADKGHLDDAADEYGGKMKPDAKMRNALLKARGALEEVSRSGREFEDSRVSYVSVQIDRSTLTQIAAALAAIRDAIGGETGA